MKVNQRCLRHIRPLLGILICVLGFVTTVLRGGVSLSLRGVRSLSDLGRLRLVSRYDYLRLMGCLSSLGCVCVFRLLCRGSCSVLRLTLYPFPGASLLSIVFFCCSSVQINGKRKRCELDDRCGMRKTTITFVLARQVRQVRWRLGVWWCYAVPM